ncbi:MAG TPA: hypothetical protein VIJ93_03990 [bacterium]
MLLEMGKQLSVTDPVPKFAKKSKRAGGVLNLVQSPHRERALNVTDVGSLWGVGQPTRTP